jgi:hypothetical protein
MQDDDAPDDDVPIQPQMMPIGGVNGGEVPKHLLLTQQCLR